MKLPALGPAARLARGLWIPVLFLLVGCDLPTSLPSWNTAWTLVGVNDAIVTSDLLPSTVREEGTRFVLDSISSRRTVKLGDVCEVCTCFSGPIPRIEITPQKFSLPLPSGVSEAALEEGRARVVVHNEVGFDLLDNGEGERGYLLAELRDLRTRETVDSVRIDDPFPPGDSLVLDFDLGGLTVHRSMQAQIQGVTPGSGCDSIDLTEDLGIRSLVTLSNVTASSVVIFLTDGAVAIDDEVIELPDLVADRLRAGEAQVSLDVELTSTVAAELDLVMSLAADPEKLFTEKAALFTPIPVAPGSLEEPNEIAKTFLLDLDGLEGAETLYLAARNRVLGSRSVPIRGGEGIRYRVVIRAELPST
jgi:hypothetical protein